MAAVYNLTHILHLLTGCCYFLCIFSGVVTEFIDVTRAVLHKESINIGIIAAFGDFNADKLTDLIIIHHDNITVSILLASNEKNAAKLVPHSDLTFAQDTDLIVTNVYPADFNADSKMDLLLFCKNVKNSNNVAKIYFGYFNYFDLSTENVIKIDDIKEQPLLFDFNGDMIPDLLAENNKGVRSIWESSVIKNKYSFNVKPFPGKRALWNPTSSAFVDINDDLVSDIIISTNGGDNRPRPVFEECINIDGTFSCNTSHSFNDSAKIFSRSVYADIDGDGHIDHVLAVCLTEDCVKSAVYYYSFYKVGWFRLTSPTESFKHAGTQWGFYPMDPNDHLLAASMNLHAGDYNLDGFIDILCILQKKDNTKSEKRIFILQNVPCVSSEICDGTRALSVKWSLSDNFHSITNPVIGAFYDLEEDGILDVVISDKIDEDYKIYIFKNKLAEDASFLKVLVTSGKCDADCDGNTPYGTSMPGPMIKYSTIRYDGSWQEGSAVQLSQNAYFSLQLPYVTFGLGRTPNFVEKLTVAMPVTNTSGSRTRIWKQIIPNSQIVIIPYPLDDPSAWTEKLFAAPSHLIVSTAATLIGTCIFISLIVGILHWRERKADRREKLEDAQHFHFDAM